MKCSLQSHFGWLLDNILNNLPNSNIYTGWNNTWMAVRINGRINLWVFFNFPSWHHTKINAETHVNWGWNSSSRVVVRQVCFFPLGQFLYLSFLVRVWLCQCNFGIMWPSYGGKPSKVLDQVQLPLAKTEPPPPPHQVRIQGGPRGPGPPPTLGFEAPKLSIFGPYLIFP